MAPPDVVERVALAPPPGEAPLPAPNAAALLRRNGTDPGFAPRPALRFGERIWTYAELFGEMTRYAALFHEPASTRPGRRMWPCFSTTRPNTCSAWAAQPWPARRWWGSTTPGATSTCWPTSATPTSSCSITEPRHQELLAPVAGQLSLPGGVLVSERFADGDDPPRTMGEALDSVLASWAPGPVTRGSSPTWRRCGCCCSPRGPRRHRRRCAAPSAGSSPRGTV